MTTSEFMLLTGVSRKTAYWIYNLHHESNNNEYRNFTSHDVDFVNSRKLENYSEGRIEPIIGFPNHYISDIGKVYTNTRGFLEEIIGSVIHGYHYIGITNEFETTYFRVHRLVGQYFVPNPDNKPVINHKDGNKLNNHYTNLEWSTISENTKHAYDNGLSRNDKGFEDSQSYPVAFLDKENILHVFGSICIANKLTGVDKRSILREAKKNQIEIDDGFSVYDIYNSFVFYSNFLITCNEYQQKTFTIIFKNESLMLLAIR